MKKVHRTVTHPADGGKSTATCWTYEEGEEVGAYRNYTGPKEKATVVAAGDLVAFSSADAWIEQRLLVEFEDGTLQRCTSGDLKLWKGRDYQDEEKKARQAELDQHYKDLEERGYLQDLVD